MATILEARWPKSFCTTNIWSSISPISRLRLNPSWPVAQKLHPIAHPTCVEKQTVKRLEWVFSLSCVECDAERGVGRGVESCVGRDVECDVESGVEKGAGRDIDCGVECD